MLKKFYEKCDIIIVASIISVITTYFITYKISQYVWKSIYIFFSHLEPTIYKKHNESITSNKHLYITDSKLFFYSKIISP